MEDNIYIFPENDPAMRLKIAEAELVKGFQNSLTLEEKEKCKTYIMYLNWPINTQEDKMKRNLAVMCFMDGYRLSKRESAKTKSLLDCAITSLSDWLGLTKESVRETLEHKVSCEDPIKTKT